MIPRNAAIGAGVLALAGLAAVAHQSSTARANQPAPAATYLAPVASAPVAAPAAAYVATPVAATDRVVSTRRVVTRTRAASPPRTYVHKRSKKHSAMIIGGSTVGGAGIGALVGGKKGALIGGLVGGAAGTVYDRKTHKKVKTE